MKIADTERRGGSASVEKTEKNAGENIKNPAELFDAEKFKNDIMNKIKGYNEDSFDLSDMFKFQKKGMDFNPQYELMRIAAAETEAELKRIIASLESKIGAVKNTKEGETLVPRIRRIIKKGRQKVGKLKTETRIRLAAEAARKRREYAKEMKHRTVLSMKKLHRKKQEADDIKNADKIADGYGTNPSLSELASGYVDSRAADAAASGGADTATAAAVAETADVSVDVSV
ncbi:MAG: hypothetical protein J1F64_07195 [Oscillospiraceae bacterium]|nr:hypothetical protein [Oscillospiraceae bacterium]